GSAPRGGLVLGKTVGLGEDRAIGDGRSICLAPFRHPACILSSFRRARASAARAGTTERHEETSFKKLGLAAETIRNLTIEEPGEARAGLHTTVLTPPPRAIPSACLPPFTASGALNTTTSQIA